MSTTEPKVDEVWFISYSWSKSHVLPQVLITAISQKTVTLVELDSAGMRTSTGPQTFRKEAIEFVELVP